MGGDGSNLAVGCHTGRQSAEGALGADLGLLADAGLGADLGLLAETGLGADLGLLAETGLGADWGLLAETGLGAETRVIDVMALSGMGLAGSTLTSDPVSVALDCQPGLSTRP
jgi:hypothetical protein